MKTLTIKYNASVMVDAGWRSVEVTAIADKISEKRVSVTRVTDIDGLGNTGYGSRTGAKRQQYHIGGIAVREEGKIKNISTLAYCVEA